MGASTAPIRSRVKCGQAGAQCSAGPEDSVSRPRLRVMTEWEAAGDHTWQPRATLWAAGVQGAPHAVAAATPSPGPTWAARRPLQLQLLLLLAGPVLRMEGPSRVISRDDLPVERALRRRTEQL